MIDSELKLLNRARDGDKTALEILISDNYAILKGYVLKLTCNKEISEDIVQETLLSAVVNIGKFKPRAKFSTYLITIATNKYRDYLRKEKETDILIDIIPSDFSVENEFIKKEELEEVLKILKDMPFEKRSSFILKHYYGYSLEEISEIMNCPKGTVRSRIHYTIKDVMKRLKGGKSLEG